MKTQLACLLALIWVLTGISGCSSDGDSPEREISEQQLQAIVGTWTLVAYEVSPPQDVNGDSTASDNLLEEMPCLSGSISFTEEFRWSRSLVQLNVAQITGGAFGLSCGPTSSDSGDWLFLNSQILLEEGADGTFDLSGNTLTRNFGNDLPGIRRLIYQKM